MKSTLLIFSLMLWGTDNYADTVQGTMDVSMNVLPSCELDIPKPWRKNPHKFRKQIRKWLQRNPHCTGHDLPPEFDDDFDDDPSKKSRKSRKSGKSSESDESKKSGKSQKSSKSKKSDKSRKSEKSSKSNKSSRRKTLTVNY
ncbi:MAG: hypothetical protein ACI82A_003942 [Candidatus Azotimanducaceae bacterium]|jgi:hypothetical protein